ncbi:hypothetical protein [Micrococcus porci]|uniref:hypothetical protein n=1 Tax=Micrococcus porci TaxID=2856555 RepID=UPI003CED00DA
MGKRETSKRRFLMMAVLLCLAGAAIITFTDLPWRGLIGAGLSLTGIALLMAGVIAGTRAKETHSPEGRLG